LKQRNRLEQTFPHPIHKEKKSIRRNNRRSWWSCLGSPFKIHVPSSTNPRILVAHHGSEEQMGRCSHPFAFVEGLIRTDLPTGQGTWRSLSQESTTRATWVNTEVVSCVHTSRHCLWIYFAWHVLALSTRSRATEYLMGEISRISDLTQLA
jgi:hypothetical protein